MITYDITMLSQSRKRSLLIRGVPDEDILKLDRIAENRRTSREAIIRECIVEKISKSEA